MDSEEVQLPRRATVELTATFFIHEPIPAIPFSVPERSPLVDRSSGRDEPAKRSAKESS